MPLEKFFSAIGKILQCHWKNSSVPLEKFFSAIGKILQCHWKNSSVPLEKFFSAIGRILQCHWKNSFHFKIGRWVESRPGRPGHPKIEKKNFDSQMIGGLFRAQSRVRLAPKTNFSGPAGPDKNDNNYHFLKFFFKKIFSIFFGPGGS